MRVKGKDRVHVMEFHNTETFSKIHLFCTVGCAVCDKLTNVLTALRHNLIRQYSVGIINNSYIYTHD
jgi:hypothetical protein